MGSRRLTEAQKAALVEQSTKELEGQCNGFIDSADGSEFHEGMASGVLLAIEVVQKMGGLNSVSAEMLAAIISRCIKESDKRLD